MSLSALFILVTPFAAVICAIGEARDQKAGLGALIICAFLGLILGIGGSMCTIALASRVRLQNVREGNNLVAASYVLARFFIPPIITTLTCVVVVWFVSVIL